MVATSATPTSSTSEKPTQPTLQLTAEHIQQLQQIFSVTPNATAHASVPQPTLTTSSVESFGLVKCLLNQWQFQPNQGLHLISMCPQLW